MLSLAVTTPLFSKEWENYTSCKCFINTQAISSGLNVPGTLEDMGTDGMGFLSFIRLVGAGYFSKHTSAFIAVSPENLYHSLQTKHKQWLLKITDVVWGRVSREDQAVPSWDALYLHWRRCVWVLKYWHI